MQVGDRVGIYRKSALRYVGTVTHMCDLNEDMMWGHKMAPDTTVTVAIDGENPRRFRNGIASGRWGSRLGYVKIKPMEPDIFEATLTAAKELEEPDADTAE